MFCADERSHQLLRQPMMFMPRAFAAIPDAASALRRLSHVFHAERINSETLVIDKTQEHAVVVRDATFEWESSEKVDEKIPDVSSRGVRGGALGGQGGSGKRNGGPANEKDKGQPPKHGPVFRVRNITLTIPRGQLAAIVGPVGSGKVSGSSTYRLWIVSKHVCTQSSLLQGIIGEMRKVSGHVSLSGRVAYCSQTAWIQNATLVSAVSPSSNYVEVSD